MLLEIAQNPACHLAQLEFDAASILKSTGCPRVLGTFDGVLFTEDSSVSFPQFRMTASVPYSFLEPNWLS